MCLRRRRPASHLPEQESGSPVSLLLIPQLCPHSEVNLCEVALAAVLVEPDGAFERVVEDERVSV